MAQNRLTAVGRVRPSSSPARSAARRASVPPPVRGQRHPVGGGDADGRRAAHRKAQYGRGHLLGAGAAERDLFEG